MRHHIMTALATCTLALGLHGTVQAVTDGPTCKAECAPRIDEQCGALAGKGFKKCKRKLVRACKATDPSLACTTTGEMTRALEDRLLHVEAAADGSADAFDLTLCAAGSFIQNASSGAWAVRIANGALVLELDADTGATRRLAAQRTAAGIVRLDGRRVASEDEGGACAGQPARPRPGDDGQNPGQNPGGGAAAEVTAALGDKILTVSTDSLFDGGLGSIVTTQEIGLCTSGSLHLFETTITSTSISGDLSSEKTFDGTWSVRTINGVLALELQTGEPEPRLFAVEIAGGQILLDGKAPDVAPNTACGGAGGQPGQPGSGGQSDDIVAQLTATFNDQVVVLEESNIGSGTTTTSFALCASGRYLFNREVSAAPGHGVEEVGSWSIRLEQEQPILVLAADGGAERVFAITLDAQNNILLNDISAQAGNADAIPAICPGL